MAQKPEYQITQTDGGNVRVAFSDDTGRVVMDTILSPEEARAMANGLLLIAYASGE